MDDTLDELLITLFQNMCLAEEDGNGVSGCSGYVGLKLLDLTAIGVILGIYWDNGKENGNYNLWCFRFGECAIESLAFVFRPSRRLYGITSSFYVCGSN